MNVYQLSPTLKAESPTLAEWWTVLYLTPSACYCEHISMPLTAWLCCSKRCTIRMAGLSIDEMHVLRNRQALWSDDGWYALQTQRASRAIIQSTWRARFYSQCVIQVDSCNETSTPLGTSL